MRRVLDDDFRTIAKQIYEGASVNFLDKASQRRVACSLSVYAEDLKSFGEGTRVQMMASTNAGKEPVGVGIRGVTVVRFL